MLGYVLAAVLLFALAMPVIILAWFWYSKYLSCPFCGGKMLKTERKCPGCRRTIGREGTAEGKVVKAGRAYGEGAKRIGEGEEGLERRLRNENRK